VLLHPAARAAHRKLLRHGWVDVLREEHAAQPPYTVWSYLRNRWPRDAGLRIDHLLLHPSLASRVVQARADKAVRGLANASDHAPAWVEIG
jgi:exodeoxyribonuclease-3